ncbi:hypothetical protein SAY87_016466 [Trapa incisa]|uniref:COP1-interacting protein 7 n=1 Tax=Trapa incisa TaxID=236973 RepID=A0AAN7L8L2_9MYRT|nr:hypothetical protein SAY87_016466 [Trapa incisa]
MKPDAPLDYVVFQLSPKRSRCELIVSRNGQSEKLASGLVKPFIAHLKVAEEQFTQNVQFIKLEARKFNNGEKFLRKGTLERFVRFVSTPEVLELVNAFDAEMSQLEAARKIYSQGTKPQYSGDSGDKETGIATSSDSTKMGLLRAIDVRLSQVRQDLTTACAQASAAGFDPDSVSDLSLFAESFGAHRLNEACIKFLSLYQRRPELIPSEKLCLNDCGLKSSFESDMSLDDPTEDFNDPQLKTTSAVSWKNSQLTAKLNTDKSDSMTTQQSKFVGHDVNQKESDKKKGNDDTPIESPMIQTSQPTRRLSVQDRINLFESRQKENAGSGGGSKPILVKSAELRRLSSDVSSASAAAAAERAVLRRWSGASDMSLDLSAEMKDTSKEPPLCTLPSASSVSQAKNSSCTNAFEYESPNNMSITAGFDRTDTKSWTGKGSDSKFKDGGEAPTMITGLSGDCTSSGGSINMKGQLGSDFQKMPFSGQTEQGESSQHSPQNKMTTPSGSEEGGMSKIKAGSEAKMRGFYKREPRGQDAVEKAKDQTAPEKPEDQATPEIYAESLSKFSEVASKNTTRIRGENVGVRNESVTQSRLKGLRRHPRLLLEQIDGGFRHKSVDDQLKGTNANQLFPRPEHKFHASAIEQVDKRGFLGSEKLQISVEESPLHNKKTQKSVSTVPEHSERSQSKTDEILSAYGNGTFSISSRKTTESQVTSLTPPTMVVEPVLRVRQSKGNQELNEDLKMKANELEKLFAEHKLRVPADQSSSRRGKTADSQKEPTESSENSVSAVSEFLTPMQCPEQNVMVDLLRVPSSLSDFSTPPSVKIDNNLDLIDSLRRNFSEPNDSRGKLYEKYMQKRDAKLREEWGSKRVEKEDKLKHMHDSLERSRAEMEARFSGAGRKDSLSSASHRMEKLRSFNSRSTMKKEQQIGLFSK